MNTSTFDIITEMLAPTPEPVITHYSATSTSGTAASACMPASYQHRLEVNAPLVNPTPALVTVIDDLTHRLRQTRDSALWHAACGRQDEALYRDGEADALADVLERLRSL